MAKKKKEHVTFDRINKAKPSLPFAKTNRLTISSRRQKISPDTAARRSGRSAEKKVIFWDFDGTLIYANRSFLCALSAALEKHGYSFDDSVLMGFLESACSWYSPDKEYPDRTGGLWWRDLLDAVRKFCAESGVSEAHIEPVCALFRENVINYDYRLYDDALTALARCRDMGYESYILSNNFPELTQVAERLGVNEYISGCFLSSEIGYEKPRTELFRRAFEEAGCPDVCCMVGDNPAADIQGGRNAGMRTILVHREDAGCGADHVCCSLTEIAELLKRNA